MSTPRATGRRGGFTIVEVVLAMGLLLLGMTAVLGLLSFGAALARTAALRTGAAAAAEAVVADLEETLFPLEIDARTGERRAGTPHAIAERPLPGHPGVVYGARATPVPAADDGPQGPRRYRVDVEMSWTTSGRRKARAFTVLLLREVPFGERLRRELVADELDPLGARLPAPAGEAGDAPPAPEPSGP
jgi:hypothetical protein